MDRLIFLDHYPDLCQAAIDANEDDNHREWWHIVALSAVSGLTLGLLLGHAAH